MDLKPKVDAKMRKLWLVKIETEVVVIAKDEDGAGEAASDALYEMSHRDMGFDATPLRYLPFGWSGKEIPWPDPDDQDMPECTVDQWIEAGAAPELVKRMAELKAAREKLRQASLSESEGKDG